MLKRCIPPLFIRIKDLNKGIKTLVSIVQVYNGVPVIRIKDLNKGIKTFCHVILL